MKKKATSKPNDLAAAAKLLAATPGKGKTKAALDESELRHRAQRWAELHANPKTRAEMDSLLAGLTEAEQRTVYLNGQRLRAGMPYKPVQPTAEQPRKETKHGSTTNHRGTTATAEEDRIPF
jgi:hypothetical protein